MITDTTIGENKKYLDGIHPQAFTTTKSISIRKENYLKSGHKFMQQKRTKIVALYNYEEIRCVLADNRGKQNGLD